MDRIGSSTAPIFAIELLPCACGYPKGNGKFKAFPITTQNGVVLILSNKYALIPCHISFCYLLSPMQPPADLGILELCVFWLPPSTYLQILSCHKSAGVFPEREKKRLIVHFHFLKLLQESCQVLFISVSRAYHRPSAQKILNASSMNEKIKTRVSG